MVSDAERFCKGCQRDLPVSSFCIDRRRKDGLCFYCRECMSIRNKATVAANKLKWENKNPYEKGGE